MGLLLAFLVLKTKTAFAVGKVVVAGVVVEIDVVISGEVVVSMQLKFSHGHPPEQFS